MKSKEVRKILGCSHTTLLNYEKRGKLKLAESTGKQRNYDDESVYRLYDEISGRRKLNNHIILHIGNQKYEFTLDKFMVNSVLDHINTLLKQQEDRTNLWKHPFFM